MSIKVACKCGKRFAAQPHLAGKRLKCPSCGLPITVPAQQTSPEITTTSKPDTLEDTQARNSAQYTSVNCMCGARLRIKQVIAGRTAKCPKCGNLVVPPATKQDAVADQGLANWFDVQLPNATSVMGTDAVSHSRKQQPIDGQHGPRCSNCRGILLPVSLFGGIRKCGRCEIDLYLVNSQNCISSTWLIRAGKNEPGHDRERIKDFRMLIQDAAQDILENGGRSSGNLATFSVNLLVEHVVWNFTSMMGNQEGLRYIGGRQQLRHMKVLVSLFHKQTGYEFATWAENPRRWIPFLSSFQRQT